MPYRPNLTNKFAIPCVCLYHVYVPAVHSYLNELYNIYVDTHATMKTTYNPNTSRISRMVIRSIRILYVSYELHYVPSSTFRTTRTVREPEQSEKSPFAYKSRRISHSSLHFLITMKNSIQADQRNRNDCSRQGANSLCSSSPLN